MRRLWREKEEKEKGEEERGMKRRKEEGGEVPQAFAFRARRIRDLTLLVQARAPSWKLKLGSV